MSEDDDQSGAESVSEQGNGDNGSERASILTNHVSIPSSSHSRQPIADAEVDALLFHAFPERKYFRSVILAQLGFVIMTVLVLGNLIYT
jgi:hypothetical protein